MSEVLIGTRNNINRQSNEPLQCQLTLFDFCCIIFGKALSNIVPYHSFKPSLSQHEYQPQKCIPVLLFYFRPKSVKNYRLFILSLSCSFSSWDAELSRRFFSTEAVLVAVKTSTFLLIPIRCREGQFVLYVGNYILVETHKGYLKSGTRNLSK